MITEIVTWTNQKIENVKTNYTIKPGFLYNTSVTEIRALIGILLFLGATKSSKKCTASIWPKDGTGKPICIAAISQKRFFLCIAHALTIQPRWPSEEPMTGRHLFVTFTTNLSQLVKQTTLQELVAQLMNLSWNSEEGVVSGYTHHINRVNTASKYMFWWIAKPPTRFLPKFTRELTLMHRDCQSQPKLFWIWFRQFREQTGTLPLTIITLQFLWPWS